VDGTSIGIKVADGSFYPVLEESFTGRKKLVLTTVRDNQTTVQIDLYRGEGDKIAQNQYVGSLIIENIQPAPKGEPEVEVNMGVDEEGNLEATASDLFTGERQSLSVSLKSLAGESLYSVPEFDFNEEMLPAGAEQSEEGDEDLLTGEAYPIGPKDRRKEHLAHKKRSPLLLVGFVLLGLLIIAGLAFLIYRSLSGAPLPSLLGGKVTPLTVVQEAPKEEVKAETPPAAPMPPALASPAEKKTTPGPGTLYLVKRGDTLWDISASFYRNPWLYPKIARANQIVNPDIIFAGQKIVIPEE